MKPFIGDKIWVVENQEELERRWKIVENLQKLMGNPTRFMWSSLTWRETIQKILDGNNLLRGSNK